MALSLFWLNEISIYSLTVFLCICLCEASVASEKCSNSSGILGGILSISKEISGCDVCNGRVGPGGEKVLESSACDFTTVGMTEESWI